MIVPIIVVMSATLFFRLTVTEILLKRPDLSILSGELLTQKTPDLACLDFLAPVNFFFCCSINHQQHQPPAASTTKSKFVQHQPQNQKIIQKNFKRSSSTSNLNEKMRNYATYFCLKDVFMQLFFVRKTSLQINFLPHYSSASKYFIRFL